jgi:uncharacterized repeat protein (TIGR03837 family)
MAWDLFCRVIDNFGDVGVCWRLAHGLAAGGRAVRLWIDDASALRWMAPGGDSGVQVLGWHEAELAEPGEVVIEAFGCDPPASFVARMAQQPMRPMWINLEYLSAESYVERSHGLRSPQLAGPGTGLVKWFFYPGFGPGTGGLLRGAARPASPAAWLAERGWAPMAGERVALLFCYDNLLVPRLLQGLATHPTLLLAAPGPAQQALRSCTSIAGLRTIALPWLPQTEFDQLLHCTDLNIVRGEDSFAQAQWPGVPFLWQLYPQADGAHGPKLEAFLDRFVKHTGLADAAALRALWRAWNGLAAWPPAWPDMAAWRNACGAWRDGLLGQPDLITQIFRFVAERR